jgi:hypothetical protein
LLGNCECPIWGTPSLKRSWNEGDSDYVYSPRAGGEVIVKKDASEFCKSLNPIQKSAITNWLVDRRIDFDDKPILDLNLAKECSKIKPIKISDSKTKFMRYIMDIRPNEQILFTSVYHDMDLEDKFHTEMILAQIGAVNYHEALEILRLLEEDNLITIKSGICKITSNGYNYIESMGSKSGSPQAFVALWFHDETNQVWRQGIMPAIKDAGYEPLRIDNKPTNGKICDEIISEIKNSRFLVADFTCRLIELEGVKSALHRGGVYYEAGFAMGHGIDVIFTCRADCIDHLHFDTRQFSHIKWKNPSDLRNQLYHRISRTIGVRPDAPGLGQTAIEPDPVRKGSS